MREGNAGMTERKKILIVYARFGEGHRQAAGALQQAFGEREDTDARLVDLMAESHPVLDEFSRFVYRSSYRVLPRVYGWVYEATREMKSDSAFAGWLHSFGAETMLNLLRRERPDAVVHTFPMLALPAVQKRLDRKIPMFNVVTDFDLHTRWVHPEVDKYYVATDDLRNELQALGYGPERVAATGIPVRRGFSSIDRTVRSAGALGAIAARYGLSPHRPVVLVMADNGSAPTDVVAFCAKLERLASVQTAIVCGRNEQLRRWLAQQAADNGDVAVLGYVERMEELMALADCIVTKPGGLTLSEAIVAGLPMFLYRPVPGQERNNALYMEKKGAAVIRRTPDALAEAIAAMLHDPMRRLEMQLNIRKLRKNGAAERIAFDIARQLHIMEEARESLVRL